MQHPRQRLGRHLVTGPGHHFHESVQFRLIGMQPNPDRFGMAGMGSIDPAISRTHVGHVKPRRQTPERGRIKSCLYVAFQQRKEV